MSPLVVLVGPPGAGKTTVGRLLAAQTGVGFRDTDADVAQRAGVPVGDIFVEHGEQQFRALERDAVAAALTEHDGVLAVGGGAVVDPATRAALTAHPVVFLDVGLAEATARVGLGTSRPLLLGNVRATLKRLMDERRPHYEEVAVATVSTDGRDPNQVARGVRERLGR